jgi:hypothetical protein
MRWAWGDLFVWWWWMCELEVDGLDWSGEQKLEVNRRVGGQCAAAARRGEAGAGGNWRAKKLH